MKIKGTKSGLISETVHLDRGNDPKLSLKVTAMPMGFMEKIREKIPGPIPKATDVLRKGGSIVRDETGKPVFLTNESTLEFRRDEDLANRRQSTMMIAKGLEHDPQVSFDAQREGCKNDAEYADKLWAEFKDFGFGSGNYTELLLHVLRVSGVTRKKINDAREDFTLEG